MIPYGKQHIDESDIEAVVSTLKSDWLTQGPAVPRFEKALTDYTHAAHAVAVNSATSALHLACLALDIKKGDTIWTSPNSFVASANCVIYCGASIDFVDIDLSTGNMCTKKLEEKLSLAKKQRCLPRALIPVHFAGQSCDMETISRLAKQYNFYVIEDASHAVGASYRDKPVGCCAYSDICVFSFHPVKIVTTIEGGAALTNSEAFAEKMRLARSHGVTSDPDKMTESPHGPWYYQQVTLGYNYRMNDVEAALGLSQLKKLDDYVARRNAIAKQYAAGFANEDFIQPLAVSEYCYSSYHLFCILATRLTESTHRQVIENLRARGVFAHVHYIPIHLQPFYTDLGFKKGDFPQAEDYYRQVITLPLFPSLTDNEVQFIIHTVKEVLSGV